MVKSQTLYFPKVINMGILLAFIWIIISIFTTNSFKCWDISKNNQEKNTKLNSQFWTKWVDCDAFYWVHFMFYFLSSSRFTRHFRVFWDFCLNESWWSTLGAVEAVTVPTFPVQGGVPVTGFSLFPEPLDPMGHGDVFVGQWVSRTWNAAKGLQTVCVQSVLTVQCSIVWGFRYSCAFSSADPQDPFWPLS